MEDIPGYQCLKCGCDYDYELIVGMGEEQFKK